MSVLLCLLWQACKAAKALFIFKNTHTVVRWVEGLLTPHTVTLSENLVWVAHGFRFYITFTFPHAKQQAKKNVRSHSFCAFICDTTMYWTCGQAYQLHIFFCSRSNVLNSEQEDRAVHVHPLLMLFVLTRSTVRLSKLVCFIWNYPFISQCYWAVNLTTVESYSNAKTG